MKEILKILFMLSVGILVVVLSSVVVPHGEVEYIEMDGYLPVFISQDGHNGISYAELYVKGKDNKYYLFEKTVSGRGQIFEKEPVIVYESLLSPQPVFYGYLSLKTGTLYYYDSTEGKLVKMHKIPGDTLEKVIMACNH